MGVALGYFFIQYYIQTMSAANKSFYWMGTWSYEGRTKSHEQQFFVK